MAKTATVQTLFPGTSTPSGWFTSPGSGTITFSNQVSFNFPATTVTNEDLGTNSTYDATSSYALTFMTSAGNQSLATLGVFPLQLFLGGGTNSNSNVAFYLNQNTLAATYDTGSGRTVQASSAYNPAFHKYFIISESGGTLTWSTSPDGQHLSTFAQKADPITLTAITYQIFCQIGSEATSTAVTFASVGFWGPVPRARELLQGVQRGVYGG